jgi:hypothetical protein
VCRFIIGESMSNRIPDVVKKFSDTAEKKDDISYLSFPDWFAKKENESQDWVIVARSWKEGLGDLFTYSALASIKDENENDNIKKILSNNSWDIHFAGFGKPNFCVSYGDGKEPVIHYDPGLVTEVDGIEFKPFVIYRDFHRYISRTFEVVQNFILYHEAFYVPEEDEFQRIDEQTGELHSVIRFKRNDNNVAIEVDSCHLKDYLAANQSYLVRYHDHTRYAVTDITEDIGDTFKSCILSDELFCFDLWLRTDIPIDEFKSVSRLCGKDIVIPYPKLSKHHYLIHDTDEIKFEKFVIGRNDNGNLIESTCNEQELSNYFIDRGTPHDLTPVYFRKKILTKYYHEPRRYTVGSSSLSCFDLWSIPIDITDEGFIQVWLKDLGNLPYEEQLYWKTFNVPPKGTISNHRWKRYFLGEPANPENDPIFYFKTSFYEIQRSFTETYGDTLFIPLKGEDSYLYKILRLPLTEEDKEFDEQIQAFAKITSDSLNVELLKKETGIKIGVKIDDREIKGSIDLFEFFLDSSLNIERENIEQIVTPLRAIQSIRSYGVAHRRGSDYITTYIRQVDN